MKLKTSVGFGAGTHWLCCFGVVLSFVVPLCCCAVLCCVVYQCLEQCFHAEGNGLPLLALQSEEYKVRAPSPARPF